MKRNKCAMCNQPDSRNDTRQLSEPNEPGALFRQQVFTTFYSLCCSLYGNSKGRQLWGMTDRTKSNLCTIMHILAFSTSFIILFITFYYQKILPLRKSIVTDECNSWIFASLDNYTCYSWNMLSCNGERRLKSWKETRDRMPKWSKEK